MEQKSKNEGEQSQFGGTGTIGNQTLNWGTRDNADLFQGNKGTGNPT